ncbi:MAG TPA: RNA methyltransferase [Candidatus Thermoplasmatota archaeon]|nr:RNA methyltransferase [Candidatus Thermoplasmatota archaeon]
MQPPIVVLVSPSHPGNVGASARGAANFGVAEMRVVAPRCDVRGKEALDRAVHAEEMLRTSTTHPDLASALEGVGMSVATTARMSLAENHFLRRPMDIRDWLESVRGWDGRLAFVFGPEDAGLTKEQVNLCDQTVTIPTAEYWSLNLSHAVTLLCYEHFKLRSNARAVPERTLDPGALAALHKAWDALVDETEERGWRREVASGVWRKIVGRSSPDTYEVHNIMGVLTRALKRFQRTGYSTPKSERVLREKGLLAGSGPDEKDD